MMCIYGYLLLYFCSKFETGMVRTQLQISGVLGKPVDVGTH